MQNILLSNSHLHPAYIPSETHSRSGAKCKEVPVHIAIVLDQPSLWFEGVDILAEDLFFAMDHPRIGADDASSGKVFPSHLETSLGYTASQTHAHSWMHASIEGQLV